MDKWSVKRESESFVQSVNNRDRYLKKPIKLWFNVYIDDGKAILWSHES